MWAAVDYSVPYSIDVERGSDSLGITAPRLAQHIPNYLLAGGDLEFFLLLYAARVSD
jgi:hypothetical protein